MTELVCDMDRRLKRITERVPMSDSDKVKWPSSVIDMINGGSLIFTSTPSGKNSFADLYLKGDWSANPCDEISVGDSRRAGMSHFDVSKIRGARIQDSMFRGVGDAGLLPSHFIIDEWDSIPPPPKIPREDRGSKEWDTTKTQLALFAANNTQEEGAYCVELAKRKFAPKKSRTVEQDEARKQRRIKQARNGKMAQGFRNYRSACDW